MTTEKELEKQAKNLYEMMLDLRLIGKSYNYDNNTFRIGIYAEFEHCKKCGQTLPR